MFAMDSKVFAHRGANRLAPENTLAAFLQAKMLGISWLEFDVMLSKDNEVVVIHDETLNRTTNGKGNVHDYPYAILKTLDAGSWFNPKFSTEKIPLLRDVITFLKENHMSANIEIKALPGLETLTVQKVLAEINLHWTKEMLAPLVSSFSLPALKALRMQSKTIPIGFLMDEWNSEWKKIADELQCVSIHLNEKLATRENILAIKNTKRLVFCYTINDKQHADALFTLGVDAVFSDVPDKIIF